MSRTLSTARFAAILAVAAIIFSAGLVSGAAGDPLILGLLTNNAGASGTKVTSSVNGNAFAVAQTGVGASANGIRGDANTGTGGVFTSSSNNALFATAASGNRFAMVAVSGGGAGTGGAILADGNLNEGLVATSDDTTAIRGTATNCDGFLCGAAGVHGIGVGLSGGVVGEGPLGVFGIDSIGTGFGLFTQDDANISGDLTVGGTCTGCTAAVMATNGSDVALARGTAVKALGVTTDAAGNLLVSVAPAASGDVVFGIVAAGSEAVQSGTADEPITAYKDAGDTAAPGGVLKVITSGIVTFAAADASGGAIAAGDALGLSATSGALTKVDAAAPAAGIALGTLADGRVAIYLD